MMQGDACYLAIRILNNAGNPVTHQDVIDLEITIGKLRKTHLRGELIHQDGLWFFPLTQHETHHLWPGNVKAQVRLLWKNGVVEGKALPAISIRESKSKEVL